MGSVGSSRLVPGARGFVKKGGRKVQPAVMPPRPVVAEPVAPPAPPSVALQWIDRVTGWLPALGLVVVAMFALRRLDDFDTWWHMAAGRWIVQNGSVPDTDVLSYTVPQNEWINLQWLFDVILYGTWNIGGANALVVLSTVCFVATFALLARHLARYAGPVVTTMLLVWVAATVNERFLIRPEMASFPLLAAIQLVIAYGRERPERLRLLVPLMILWTNMHSLFILGAGAILCAIGGAIVARLPILPAGWRADSAWPDAARRELFVWGGVALVATLVNPYFVRGVLFPFELMSRIDGSSNVYGSIGEFRPPFSGYFVTFAMLSYQIFVYTAAGLAVLAGMIRMFGQPEPERPAPPVEAVAARGRFDIAMLAFALALGWLSLLARRNVGVFAVGAVPFVASALSIVLVSAARMWGGSTRMVERIATVALVATMAVIGVFVVSNRWYATTGETHEFGFGILESNFQPRATAFFRELGLPSPMYNDMTAGGYLTWDDPTGKGVYVDGRLEVYDTPFFGTYLSNSGNMEAWQKDADARGVQSAMVFHRWGNRHSFIRGLISTRQWMLVYYDDTVATFVRAAGHEDLVIKARNEFQTKWRQKTSDALTAPTMTYSWQWSIGRYTGQLTYARLLETIGDRKGALEWFEKAISVGLPKDFEVDARRKAALYLENLGQSAAARVHLVRALEVDPTDENARAMLTELDARPR